MARWLLLPILCGFVLLAVGYSLGTPPWEAPDEPSHYLYAEHIASHGALPPEAQPQSGNFWEGGYVTSLYEWYQPPLYYALVAPLIALVDLVRPGTVPQAFPPVDPAFPFQARNLFAHSLEPAFVAPALRLARAFSVVLGLSTLLVVYRMALVVSSGDQAVALTSTGLMAFTPQYTFLSGYVSSDNLALLLSALCLLAFLRLLAPTGRHDMVRVAGTGALLALTLYTKLSLLFLLPLGLGCLVLRLVHHRSVGRWLLESAVLAGVAIAPFLLGLLALPGLRDQVAYAYSYLRVKPELISLDYLAGLWPQTYTSFWGKFGWMNVDTPRWIADVLTSITAVGMAGSVVLLARDGERSRLSRCRQSLLLLWAAFVLVAIGFLRFNLSVRQPQGRLLYAALPALVVLAALGLRHLVGRHYALVGTALVLFTFAVNLLCLFGVLLPAYAPSV